MHNAKEQLSALHERIEMLKSGMADRQSGQRLTFIHFGVLVALDVRLSAHVVAAWVVSLKRPWTRVVVRVVGSWMAASGLFMLGWFLRGCCQ